MHVRELDLFVTVMLLEDTAAVLSLRKLCEDDGYTYHWTSGQKPHLTKNGKKINCKRSNCVPFVVLPCLSTSFSTSPSPTSSTSSSQDFGISTENPATERSEITSEELRGNLQHKPKEIENKTKNEGHEGVQSDLLHDLPDWLQDFRKNWVDNNVQPHQYSPSQLFS